MDIARKSTKQNGVGPCHLKVVYVIISYRGQMPNYLISGHKFTTTFRRNMFLHICIFYDLQIFGYFLNIY